MTIANRLSAREIDYEIEKLKKLRNEMVGTLYRDICASRINELLEAKTRLAALLEEDE